MAESRKQKTEGTQQNDGRLLRFCRQACSAPALAWVWIAIINPLPLLADGGTLRLMQRDGNLQISVFTLPAVPRVGVIDISVLVQDAATGKTRSDVPSLVRLQSLDQPGLFLERSANSADATNKLFRAALLDIPQPGRWRASILIDSNWTAPKSNASKDAPLEFDLVVGPPLPAWVEIAPWIVWPLALSALFIFHQVIVFRSAKRRKFRVVCQFNSEGWLGSNEVSPQSANFREFGGTRPRPP